MSKEIFSAPKVRKSHQKLSNALTANDKDIRIVKIPKKKDPSLKEAPDPFSTWNMPPQQDGYLKGSHNDCL
jgi:hypothetical protein